MDREEYLLGRSVDKTLEQLNEEEKQKQGGIVLPQPKNHVEHECIPPSIRDYKLQVGEQVWNSFKHINNVDYKICTCSCFRLIYLRSCRRIH